MSLNWAVEMMKEEKKRLEQKAAKSDGNEEPHMLHLVYLVKRTHGRPWWEKEIVRKLNLEGKVRLRTSWYLHQSTFSFAFDIYQQIQKSNYLDAGSF